MIKFYQIPIPPSLYLSLSTLAGIYSEFLNIPLEIQIVFCSVFIGILLFLFNPKPRKLFLIIFCCAGFVFGGYRFSSRLYIFNKARLLASENVLELEGKVEEINRLKNKRVLKVLISELRAGKKIDFARGLCIFLVLANKANNINDINDIKVEIGDKICQKKVFFSCSNYKNKLYLLRNSVIGRLKTTKAENFSTEKIIDFGIKKIFEKVQLRAGLLREELQRKLKDKIPQKTFEFFESIFLGRKNTNSGAIKETRDLFLFWGILHYLARSGLHLIIFLILWSFLLRFAPISIMKKKFFLHIFVIFFWMLSYSSLPFNRALITYLITQFIILTKCEVQPINTLSIVCLIIILQNPFHVLFLDFQLSFSLTLALLVLNEVKMAQKVSNKFTKK